MNIFVKHKSNLTLDLETLVIWELWKHRNVIVFDQATPSIRKVLTAISEEGILMPSLEC